MTAFPDCDEVVLEGGANDGVYVPVAHNIDVVEFYIKGGGLITYRRVVPVTFKGGRMVFRLEE